MKRLLDNLLLKFPNRSIKIWKCEFERPMSKWPILKVTEMINRQCFHEFFFPRFFPKKAFWLRAYEPETEVDIFKNNKSFSVKTSYSVLYHVDFVENKNICSIWFFSEFGPIVIDYGKVQAKVSMKYDSWHKDALSKFGTMLGTDMSSFHSTVMIWKLKN